MWSNGFMTTDIFGVGFNPKSQRQSLLFHAQLREDEDVIQRDFFQEVVASRRTTVTGSHVRLQQEDIVVSFERTQFGDVLGRFPIHNLTVIE